MKVLEGKVAIVTGGASGIGKATARLFADEGARVVVADTDVLAGRAVVDLIEQVGGQAFFQPLDVRSDEQCAALVAATLARFGQLDIAFNNAGISGSPALTDAQPLEQWRLVLDVNLTGVFNCMVHQLRAMKGQGGSIINTASIMGLQGTPGACAYSASKHGVIGLTRSAALEYGKHGVRINALCPGYVTTPMTTGPETEFDARTLELALKRVPLRRMGEPFEQAEMVLWLASDSASYVTGAHFVVDGGVTA
ncbi:SDR family NAD(P)-dependent oxidoreductase [Pseudomonas auratipiscis]|uniref:SDR family NAD(P)-dependent oxidoreductase n=1 Tax=Pseudomonas auratipiscis TaxID=3115853 RepID=A0AB35WM29_9PSED|nr:MULTISPECIES: SDR family NAD(P)-dependent oxidoreductase [unclassified Pseudomonas]MEE1865081.1 SDR family NAD(P)-dependent oxidoreductase [Pseudomonas sp. 120P]MEE1955978.1 SDR family NAD(P)-dependent oxidoreductase [Pseudomonas sp. 119P]